LHSALGDKGVQIIKGIPHGPSNLNEANSLTGHAPFLQSSHLQAENFSGAPFVDEPLVSYRLREFAFVHSIHSQRCCAKSILITPLHSLLCLTRRREIG